MNSQISHSRKAIAAVSSPSGQPSAGTERSLTGAVPIVEAIAHSLTASDRDLQRSLQSVSPSQTPFIAPSSNGLDEP